MKQTFGEQISAQWSREQCIDQRLKIIEWFAKRWQNFRLIQEAALWRYPDQPIPIDPDLAQRYYRSEQEILKSMIDAEQLGLVEIFADAAGASYAFRITHEDQSLAGRMIKALFLEPP